MSTILYGILENIQQACAAAIQQQSNIAAANIPVLTESMAQVDFDLYYNLIGGSTVCVVVRTPNARAAFKNIHSPYFNNISVIATIIENVTQNQFAESSGITCEAIAEFICLAWQLFPPQNQAETMVPDDPTIGEAYKSDEWPGCVLRDVRYRTNGGVQQVLPQFDALTLTQAGASLTISAPSVLTVPVLGAAVFYTSTTNGTVPGAPTPLAQVNPVTPNSLYTAPISVVTGQLIRAAAWLNGYISPRAPGIGLPVFKCS